MADDGNDGEKKSEGGGLSLLGFVFVAGATALGIFAGGSMLDRWRESKARQRALERELELDDED